MHTYIHTYRGDVKSGMKGDLCITVAHVVNFPHMLDAGYTRGPPIPYQVKVCERGFGMEVHS